MVRQPARYLMVDLLGIDGERRRDRGESSKQHEPNDAMDAEQKCSCINRRQGDNVSGVVPELVSRHLAGEPLFSDKAKRQAHECGPNDGANDGRR